MQHRRRRDEVPGEMAGEMAVAGHLPEHATNRREQQSDLHREPAFRSSFCQPQRCQPGREGLGQPGREGLGQPGREGLGKTGGIG